MHGSLGEEGLLDHSQQPFANRAAQSNDPARSRTWNGEKVPVDDAGWPTVGTGHEYDRGTGRSRVQADGDGDRKRQRARREELERENDGVELMVRDSLREQDGDSDLDDGDAGGGHGSGAGSGKCSNKRALINVLKSYIGSGVLGLPFAYSQGGMIAGTIGMLIVALLSTVAVFLLLDCKKRLGRHTRTFGDIGFGAAGRAGHSIVEGCVVLSQLGFCTAYIIFITQNMHRYMSAYFGEQEVTLTLIPALVLLCWIRSLQVLAPFSLLAIVLILAGLATVVLASADKIGLGKGVEPYVPDTLPVFIGMAIYSFEGIGLAVPIQNSMRQPEHFPFVWILASLIIAFVYVGFGALGYSCYGAEVPGIITMVLPDNLLSFVVKLGLCVSLLFTYPLAMFPIFEIVEESWLWRTLHPARRGAARDGETAVIEDGEDAAKLSVPRMRAVRVALVLVTVFAALVIPDFSVVMAFIGSVPCNIMAFVLPTFFHAVVCWDDMGFWGRARDCGLFLLGLLAVGNCTYATVRGIVSGTGPVGR
jgi:proton-coupled amino acid transporter